MRILVLFSLLFVQLSFAQIAPSFLGTNQQLFESLQQELNQKSKGTSALISLPLPNSEVITGTLTFQKSVGKEAYLIGRLEVVDNASFFLIVSNTSWEGHIVMNKTKEAFRYYSNDNNEVYVEQTDIDKVICVNYNKGEEPTASKNNVKQKITAESSTESRPGANGVVLLDFDGQVVTGTLWADGATINAAPMNFSEANKAIVWEKVSEDFRPFNLNVTTDESVFLSYPKNRRMRCIITPTTTASPGNGGVAYVNSFYWNDDTPCWVFIDWAPNAGEAASHEIGHALGLSHDGQEGGENYYAGHNNWAPIMGVSYGKTLTQWSKGEYQNANNTEDDLTILLGRRNEIGYITDDHSNTSALATALATQQNGSLIAADNTGLITQSNDVDMFTFITGGGNSSLVVEPNKSYSNLDILATLYNSSGQVINTYNPSGLSAIINENLDQGTYYLSVEGTGSGNPLTNGYTDYGSLGGYSISGQIASSLIVQNPYEGTRWPIPGTIKAVNYDEGGENVAYHDETTINEGGEYRTDGVDIELLNNDTYVVGGIKTGEWLEYAVEVLQTSYYQVEVAVAATNSLGAFHLEMDRSIVSKRIQITTTGSTTSYRKVSDIFQLEKGNYTLRVVVESGGFNLNDLIFTPVVVDCNKDINGTATIDNCGFCTGGNTGISPCINTFEAENACAGYEAIIQTEFSGYGGSGYLNPDNNIGSLIQWSVSVPQDTLVRAVFKYSNERPISRDMELYVNGEYQVTVLFPNTETWSNWTYVPVNIALTQGENVIKITSVLAEGGPLVDLVSFSSDEIIKNSCNLPTDCHDDLNGNASIDSCAVCSGGGTEIEPCKSDCHGDLGGTASIDNCGLCAGGNTNITPNTSCTDCHGDLGGEAYVDACGECVSGNTGFTPCLTDLAEGYYTIHPYHSQLCLEVGNPIRQQACNLNEEGIWEIKKVGNYYVIQNYSDQSYVGFVGGNRGSNIFSSTAQMSIRIEKGNSNDSYLLVYPNNLTLAADVSGAETAAGGYLILWTRHGNSNQDYYFEKVETDCSGEPLGSAFSDACGNCAGGNTGVNPAFDESACVTSITEQLTQSELIAYPNPTTGEVLLSIETNWSLYNGIGKMLETGNSKKVNLSEYTQGMYVLKTNNGIIKLIKE